MKRRRVAAAFAVCLFFGIGFLTAQPTGKTVITTTGTIAAGDLPADGYASTYVNETQATWTGSADGLDGDQDGVDEVQRVGNGIYIDVNDDGSAETWFLPTQLCLEGLTVDAFDSCFAVTDPTVSTKTHTIPNANTVLPQAYTCTNQFPRSLSGTTGATTCETVTGDDINSNIAGRSLALTAGSPDTLDADPELYTETKCFNLETPATGDSGKFKAWLGLASTATEARCHTDTGTATINFNKRAKATPGTTGTDILSAGLVCDTNTQNSCASGCDVDTITSAAIGVDEWAALEIDAVSGATLLVACLKFTKDD